jgi:hypothetical protein
MHVWQGLTNWFLAVCFLLEQGVAGIFGPQAGSTSPLVQSMCDTMDIPHVETSWDTKQRRQDFLVNLHPHPSTLAGVSLKLDICHCFIIIIPSFKTYRLYLIDKQSPWKLPPHVESINRSYVQLYVELVSTWGWEKFTVLYEDGSSLVRLSNLLKMLDKQVTLRQLDAHNNHRPVLRDMRHSGENNIVLDCSTEMLPEVLKQAQQVGLMTSDQNYIITSLVSHTSLVRQIKYHLNGVGRLFHTAGMSLVLEVCAATLCSKLHELCRNIEFPAYVRVLYCC